MNKSIKSYNEDKESTRVFWFVTNSSFVHLVCCSFSRIFQRRLAQDKICGAGLSIVAFFRMGSDDNISWLKMISLLFILLLNL
jgi:hypothetical protein